MNNLAKTLGTIAATIAGTSLVIAFTRLAASPESLAPAPRVDALKPPANGKIYVAFVVSDGANIMDIVGPWEAFNDTMLTASGKAWHASDGDDMVMPFVTYTVSDTTQPINAGGLKMTPDRTFETAPKPQIIVVPAQGGRTEAQKKWLLENSAGADITMSVCTGASMLAKYGLLDGQTATTHHLYRDQMQKAYPAVHFLSGTRFVDHGRIATAGGVTSGIDLALHVVDRYYGSEVAAASADFMEYHSEAWKNPEIGPTESVIPGK
jgi:transcriptional regulator GlxA family with amidase domain